MCFVLSFQGIRKFLQNSTSLLMNLVLLGSKIASNGWFVVQLRIGTCVKLSGHLVFVALLVACRFSKVKVKMPQGLSWAFVTAFSFLVQLIIHVFCVIGLRD